MIREAVGTVASQILEGRDDVWIPLRGEVVSGICLIVASSPFLSRFLSARRTPVPARLALFSSHPLASKHATA